MSAVTDSDKGEFEKATKEIQRFQKLTIRVGYQAVDGTDFAVIDIAIYQEFGTDTIPARPFLSSAMDANRGAIGKQFQKEIELILEGKQDALKAASRMGLFAKSLVQKRIKDSPSWAKPLEQSTIDGKGSSVPLIDIGEMLNSVTYAVLEGESVIASG